MKGATMNKKYRPMAWIALALVLILVSCIGAGLIQTDFGNVTITDVRIPMPDGETLRVLVSCHAGDAGYHLHRAGPPGFCGLQYGHLQRGQFLRHHGVLQ